MGKNNIIEINGKRYDFHSGEPLDGSPSHASPAPATATAAHPKQPPTQAASKSSRPGTKATTRRPAKSPKGRKPQASRTLVRHAVKKPEPGFKRQLKAYSDVTALVTQPEIPVVAKPSVTSVDAKRLKHAVRAAKSELISRFGPPAPPTFEPSTMPVTQPPPTAKPKQPATKHPAESTDIFQRAIEQATSHQMPRLKKPHRRWGIKRHAKR